MPTSPKTLSIVNGDGFFMIRLSWSFPEPICRLENSTLRSGIPYHVVLRLHQRLGFKAVGLWYYGFLYTCEHHGQQIPVFHSRRTTPMALQASLEALDMAGQFASPLLRALNPIVSPSYLTKYLTLILDPMYLGLLYKFHRSALCSNVILPHARH